VYFNIGGGRKLPGSSIDTTVNRLARYNIVQTIYETQLSYKIENRIIVGYLGNTVKLTQLGRGAFT
jgi:hypothetical protein